jgi:surface antigen
VKPLLLLTFSSSSIKKQVYIALAMMAVIISLPAMAVFALGTSTLSILSLSFSSSPGVTGLYQGALVPGDTYAWGNCTYWVYKLRQDAGDPIPTSWGNASGWYLGAVLNGYQVDHTPTPGSIMQISDVDGGLGHVAYVTAVDPISGAWTISEMNVKGLDIVDTKTNPALAAQGFEFIHDKTALQINLNANVLQEANL